MKALNEHQFDSLQNPSLIAVVRSAGERTLDLCVTILKTQIGEKDIHIVREVPFEKALLRTYSLGAACNAKWMLTVDADVLLLPDAVSNLLEAAEHMPENYVQIEGRVFDKVFGTYRQAGVRVYRNKFLEEAMKHIPSFGQEIRPEFYTLAQLGKLGFPSRRVPVVVGIHDHEQFYCDLYRKAFVHSKKHNYLALPLIDRCLKKKATDSDFAVILQGFIDGHSYCGNVEINANMVVHESKLALLGLELQEKFPLKETLPSDWGSWLSTCLEGEAPPMHPVDQHLQPRKVSFAERFGQILKEYGPVGTARYLLAAIILRVGHMLQPGRRVS